MIGLKPSEKIYLTKRRHPLVLAINIFLGVLLLLLIIVPMVILFFIPLPFFLVRLMEISSIFSGLNLHYLALFLLSLFLPVVWQIIFLIVVDYYLDCWIVTNERVISTESLGLFNRTEASISYDKIQDITIEVKGILPALCHFGDLRIETAGEFGEFFFRQIPDPEKTKDIIFQAQREFLMQMTPPTGSG